MRFDLTNPCSDCPFLKQGGIRVHPERVREIAGGMLDSQGVMFACHKTVDYDREDENVDPLPGGKQERHCAGALIFAEKNGNATQTMRITERLGLYDRRKLTGQELVFDTLEEMLQVCIDT